ncbi:unnamed protein product [Calypogeia fissa]
MTMAMVSVPSCSSCAALGTFSSSSWSPLGGSSLSTRPSFANVSLQLHPPRWHSVRLPRRETRRNRVGAAFASLRDAQELVQSGVVRLVPSAEASSLLSEEGYALLDIRPSWEREKAFVPGSYNVPLFVEDTSTGAFTLLKRSIQQGQGGWWNGQKLTTSNKEFVAQVQAVVPPGQKLLVACGEGLRSLLALEELNNAGFEQLAWLAGGFITVRDEDFPKVEGSTKLRFAAVGGASKYVLKFATFLSDIGKGISVSG